MEWVDGLQGEVIGLDTAPIIYLIEEHPIYLEPMRYFFKAMERGKRRCGHSSRKEKQSCKTQARS